jgi:hypothetical protein
MKSDGSVVCPFEHDFVKGCQLYTDVRTEDKGYETDIMVRSSEPPRRAVKEWR